MIKNLIEEVLVLLFILWFMITIILVASSMSEFWTFGKYVSWENCIEANRLCNLRTCPETMNCCVTNCIGTPTIKGIVLVTIIGMIVTLILFILNYYLIKKNEKTD